MSFLLLVFEIAAKGKPEWTQHRIVGNIWKYDESVAETRKDQAT